MAKSKSKRKPAAKTINPNSEELKSFVRKISEKYLEDPNINSVGIGHKYKDGKATNEIAIQFTVDKKLSVAELALPESLSTTVIPEELEIDGMKIKTDVVERKYKPCFIMLDAPELEQDERKKRHELLKPGISVGNVKISAGTLGAIVYDNITGEPLILSNWHVLNGPSGVIGDNIVQPGAFDDSNINANVIGKLKRSFLGLAGDCAVCTIENRQFMPDILGLNAAPAQIANPELGDKVIKSGRTTAVTHGIVRRIEVTAKINYGSAGTQTIGAFEIGVDPNNTAEDNEISMGGDSGSVWVPKDSKGKPLNIGLGLHFAGESSDEIEEHALACPLDAVCKKLNISFTKPALDTEAQAITGRGFEIGFLAKKIALPKIKNESRGKILETGFPNNLLNYTHFSILMNKDRRLCYYTAVNIDGTSLKNIVRKGDKWSYDTRIDTKFQIGNELYKSNNIDRGHMVRRLDAVWGTKAEARIANEDTFYYTNACPQHANLNQGEWNDLEEYILGNAGVHDLKVSVFTGPVFRNSDAAYRGVKIPVEFWKVVAFVREDTDELSVTGYLLSQKEEMDNLEEVFVYGEFRTYQVPVSKIEGLTNISFGTFKKYDPLNIQAESITIKPLKSLTEIVF